MTKAKTLAIVAIVIITVVSVSAVVTVSLISHDGGERGTALTAIFAFASPIVASLLLFLKVDAAHTTVKVADRTLEQRVEICVVNVLKRTRFLPDKIGNEMPIPMRAVVMPRKTRQP